MVYDKYLSKSKTTWAQFLEALTIGLEVDKTYTFLWLLTLVSANIVPSNSGQVHNHEVPSFMALFCSSVFAILRLLSRLTAFILTPISIIFEQPLSDIC